MNGGNNNDRNTILLTPVAAAKLRKLTAAVEAAERQLYAFLHGYLAAQGIEEAAIEHIDLEAGVLVVSPNAAEDEKDEGGNE